MKKTFTALAFVLASASASQAATITNGSFEDGTNPGGYTTVGAVNSTAITGWTVQSGSVDYIGTYWEASDGNRSIDLNGGSAGTITTEITGLEAGTTYEVLFDLSGNPDAGPTDKDLTVSAGVDEDMFSYMLGSNTKDDMNWVTQSFTFVATGTTAILSFSSDVVGAFGPALDNVRIAAVVPVPAAGLLLIGALGGLAAMRRRKTAASV